jgi:hypothetical protein
MSDPNQPPPPGGGFPPPPPPGGGFPPPPPPPGQPPYQPPGGGGYGGPPGGFNPPPAQPYGGNGQPQLDVGAALGYGWKKFRENTGPFVILMLAVAAAALLVSLIQAIITPDNGGFIAFVWSMGVSVLAYVAMAIVQAGVWRASLGVTQGRAPEVTQLTETGNIGPFIITNLLVGLGFFVGLVLCVIPGIIWLVLTAYAPLIALDRGTDPVTAIRTSIDWVRGNLGQVLPILVVCYIVYVAGAFLCLIGLLVTVPVALVAITYSYRALTNEPVAP